MTEEPEKLLTRLLHRHPDSALAPRAELELGLVLYELYTGTKAFDATSLAELRSRQSESPPTAPSRVVGDIDPTVERVILHCLEYDPVARPETARHVAAALPGGDPLAAAIAAGQTPSPQMVAAAGAEGSLRPALAGLGAQRRASRLFARPHSVQRSAVEDGQERRRQRAHGAGASRAREGSLVLARAGLRGGLRPSPRPGRLHRARPENHGRAHTVAGHEVAQARRGAYRHPEQGITRATKVHDLGSAKQRRSPRRPRADHAQRPRRDHRCLYVLGVARSLRGGELPEGRSRPVAGADL